MYKKMANMKTLERICDDLFLTALNNNVFPGSTVGVSVGIGKSKKSFIKGYGKSAFFPIKINTNKDVFYDLASLTKPLATTLAILCLCKEKKISLADRLEELLLEKVPGDNKYITLADILSHSSGLPAHSPYYNFVSGKNYSGAKKWIVSTILSEELEARPGEKNIYSDLGFILLGRIIEIQSGYSLDTYFVEKVLKPVGLENDIIFNNLEKKNSKKWKEKKFAATEYCPVRKKNISGVVHDLNAFVMGGVAGHAGLFGKIEGVLTLVGLLLAQWHGEYEHPNIDTDMLREFFRKREEIKGSCWALGFDTPAKIGSSGGKYLAEKSIGHLGYTGTSFWIDLEKKLVMVLLTNRIHPHDDNVKIREFRPLFHNTVMEALNL